MIASSTNEHSVTVGYDDAQVGTESLRAALEAAGYTMGEPSAAK